MSKRQNIERDFQKQVLSIAKEHGWIVYSIPDSRFATCKGFPDLTLLHPETNKVFYAELKAPKGRVTKEQDKWMTALSETASVHLWKPEHLDTIQTILETGNIDNTETIYSSVGVAKRHTR